MLPKKLKLYNQKRNPKKTPEPFSSETIDKNKLFFVIQKHKATALHYDFRLEVDGVMVSWAVPKGPSLDASVKRLAAKTEDHPVDYRKFEGVIPEGEYGGGQVIIWDEGEYIPEKEVSPGKREEVHGKQKGIEVMANGLEKGEIKFCLFGKKLKGSFALVKTNGFPPGSKDSWLMIKHRDKYVKDGYDAKDLPKSVKSGKTIEDLM